MFVGVNVNWREFVSLALGGLDAVDCGCLLVGMLIGGSLCHWL